MKFHIVPCILLLMTCNVFAQEQFEYQPHELKKATFAGGCFWCMEPPFEALDGVKEVLSGYTAGTTQHPTYDEVSSGATGHIEAVQVIYDPVQVTYEQLLKTFWQQIDPTDVYGQFADKGSQYITAIFYADETEKSLAEKSREAIEQSGYYHGQIVTKILPATTFYPAEPYHQDYYKKNPRRYNRYKKYSGREQYLKKIWDKEETH